MICDRSGDGVDPLSMPPHKMRHFDCLAPLRPCVFSPTLFMWTAQAPESPAATSPLPVAVRATGGRAGDVAGDRAVQSPGAVAEGAPVLPVETMSSVLGQIYRRSVQARVGNAEKRKGDYATTKSMLKKLTGASIVLLVVVMTVLVTSLTEGTIMAVRN